MLADRVHRMEELEQMEQERRKSIDWEYYSSHFPNPIPKKSFDAVLNQAELEFCETVPKYIWDGMEESRKQNCMFNLCNFIYQNESVLSGSAVTSVGNNGYSETYAFRTPDAARDAMKKLIYDSIGTRLAGAF